MKKILILFLFLSIPYLSKAQNKAIDKIMENFKQQEDCWNRGDTQCYCEAYAEMDSVRTISRAGVTYGKQNILADHQKYWPKERMGKLHFDQMKTEKLSGKFYFVTGRFNLAFENGKKASGYFSVLMIKQNGAWKIYTDHSS